MSPLRYFSPAERRARLVARHHLCQDAEDIPSAVRAVVAQHSSDPIAPHLSMWARVPDYGTSDLQAALCEARSLWRLHAMRRTLWIVDTAQSSMFFGAAAIDIAQKERRRVLKLLRAELDVDVEAWLDGVEDQVISHLGVVEDASTKEMGKALPLLQTPITSGSGKWARRAPVSSRLLMVMAMEGRIARTRPDGGWRSSQYRWALAEKWFGGSQEPSDPIQAERGLLEAYIQSYGPVTDTDVRWWTGWTVKRTRRALAAVEPVTVQLDGGAEAYLLKTDGPVDLPEPAAALLPGLDSTVMGWKERSWYLGNHTEHLFDRNGNAGPTAWWHGRVVGGWGQRTDGEVVVRLLEDVGTEAEQRIQLRAAQLQAWLGGVVVTPRFRTPLERALRST